MASVWYSSMGADFIVEEPEDGDKALKSKQLKKKYNFRRDFMGSRSPISKFLG